MPADREIQKKPDLPRVECTNDDEAQKLSRLVASLRYIDQKSPVPVLGIVQSVAPLRETAPTIVKSVANTASTSSPYPPKDYKTVGKPRR
jgi:hypothetical protein